MPVGVGFCSPHRVVTPQNVSRLRLVSPGGDIALAENWCFNQLFLREARGGGPGGGRELSEAELSPLQRSAPVKARGHAQR